MPWHDWPLKDWYSIHATETMSQSSPEGCFGTDRAHDSYYSCKTAPTVNGFWLKTERILIWDSRILKDYVTYIHHITMYYCIRGARRLQWWEGWPPTNVVWVPNYPGHSIISGLITLLLVLVELWGFFSGLQGFPPPTKTNTTFQFDLETLDDEPLHGMCHCQYKFQ